MEEKTSKGTSTSDGMVLVGLELVSFEESDRLASRYLNHRLMLRRSWYRGSCGWHLQLARGWLLTSDPFSLFLYSLPIATVSPIPFPFFFFIPLSKVSILA